MGSGQSQNRGGQMGVPGGGIAGLAPQVGGQMGGFGQMMNQAVTPPGGQYGAPLPGTPGMFPTQSSAMGAMGGMQTTQMPPGSFYDQMTTQPAQQLGGTPGMGQSGAQQGEMQRLMDAQRQRLMGAQNQLQMEAQMPPGSFYDQMAPQPALGAPRGMQTTQMTPGGFMGGGQKSQQFGPQVGMGGFGGGQMAQPAMGPFAQAAQRQQGFGSSFFGAPRNPMSAGLGAIGPRPGAPSMTQPRPTGGRPAGFEGYR